MTTAPKQRILYLLPQPFMVPRGSSFRAHATVKAMADLGFEVDLLAYPFGGDMPNCPGVRVIRWRSVPRFRSVKIGPSLKKLLIDIPYFVRVIYQVLTNRYAAIHGVEEAGIMAAIIGRLCGLPYIFDMHSWMSQQLKDSGFWPLKPFIGIFEALELSCMRRARAIITVGPSMTEILKELTPDVPAYTLLDCALELPDQACQNQISQIVSRYRLQDKKILLYTGNLESYQGIDLLLSSFAMFLNGQTERHRYTLLLVGGDEDTPQMSLYQNMARDLGIFDQVVFAGAWPVETMPAFIEIADALVSPRTQGNNVPFKVYTYLASGKITLATTIDSHTQVLTAHNSLLHEPNTADFAKGIDEALNPSCHIHHATLTARAKDASLSKTDSEEFKRTIAACYDNIRLPDSLAATPEYSLYQLAISATSMGLI